MTATWAAFYGGMFVGAAAVYVGWFFGRWTARRGRR